MHLSLAAARVTIGNLVPPSNTGIQYAFSYYVGERCTSEYIGQENVTSHRLQRMCYPIEGAASSASSVLIEVKSTARTRYTFETYERNCGGWVWGSLGSRVLVSPNEQYCMLLNGTNSILVYSDLRRA
ncbi:hypothetical protein GGTG_12677 [Gaeumannomyces tritici R3-111a-1]|uniref:Uncharacterized protein n=1 Tax=Gaeumannomyces tritici (strain R3-111a-1) TaxID=644352 RepID=J3PGP8_GAET3|nr:hypothetical protein GGTG_12677 [Gaeumannomyces tritici R3-111a-1]EJT69794.1 hypothetical protein GGTG_12677 [Gaeumannomyces tritici R3-111a-1]